MTTDLARLQELLAAEEPLNWVFAGDSITHGLTHTQGARGYVEHWHELIRADLGRGRDAVINTAISGWRIQLILEDFDSRVASRQPHVVALMIGTNDCSTAGSHPIIEPSAFEASLIQFVRRVRELGAIPVLQTPPAVDASHAPERARIADFAQAARDVAAQEGTILVDHFAFYAGAGAGPVPWALMDDPFHPNALGHAALAVELADALGIRPPVERDRVLPVLRARVAAR